jgi:hypothetical protein
MSSLEIRAPHRCVWPGIVSVRLNKKAAFAGGFRFRRILQAVTAGFAAFAARLAFTASFLRFK